MTIQDAITSGKLFRRRGWDYWLFITPYGHFATELPLQEKIDYVQISVNHFLATDWEVKE